MLLGIYNKTDLGKENNLKRWAVEVIHLGYTVFCITKIIPCLPKFNFYKKRVCFTKTVEILGIVRSKNIPFIKNFK